MTDMDYIALAQRFGAENENKAGDGQIVLFTGTEFTATDKHGKTYRYRMVGAEVTRDGLIRLLNLDTNSLTYVEPEWFRQRKIKVTQKEEQTAQPQNGAEDCTYLCRDCKKRRTCDRYAHTSHELRIII